MDDTRSGDPASTGRSPRPCDSCGVPDDRLEPVHRVYLDIDELGRVRDTTVLPDTEWWCPACRATYPNVPVPDTSGP
jgi:hypothetical protein